jgi:pimeloyl-ACP methyl ester carboxylesterase
MADSDEGKDCVNPGRDDWSKTMSARIIELTTKAAFFDTQLSEFKATQGRSSRELMAKSHPLGAMPITILTADEAHFNQTNMGATQARKYAAWIAGHDEIAKGSTRGETMIVEGAGHFIHLDKPELVLGKFREMLENVRRAPPSPP